MFRAQVRSDRPTYVPADAEHPVQIINAAGGDLFHKAAPDVDTGDVKLETGESVTTTDGLFLISDVTCEIVVREIEVVTVQDVVAAGDVTAGDDLTVGDDATIGDKLVVNGEAELNGDLNHDGAKVGFFGKAPVAPSQVKKAALTANELATELAKMGLVTIEA